MRTEPANKNTNTTTKIADLLYLQAPISNMAIVIVAVLYYLLLKDYTIPDMQFVWPVLMLVVAAFRLLLWYQRKRTPDRRSETQWIHIYTMATGLAGLAWSSILFFPYTNQDIVLYVALLMIVFGVTSSALPILSVYLPAYFFYIIPIIFAFITALYQHSVPDLLILATIIYFAMLSFFARNTQQHIIKSIQFEFYNQSLINKLQNEVEQREALIKARTEQIQQSNRALINSEERLKNVINGAELGYWDFNYQTGHQEVNDRWLEILGLSREDIKNTVDDWQSRIHPDDRKRMQMIVEKAILNRIPYTADFRMKHKDGHWVWIQGSGSMVEYDLVTNEPLRLCGTHQDISYRKNIEMELEYQAKHDYLTNLFNRVELEKFFQEEIIRAERYQHPLSIFMIDIDHFKKINDEHGHQSGDKILQQFAVFLQDSIRTSDYIARYGGEEFVVILPETSSDKANELAERIFIKLSKLNISLNEKPVRITISLGIASYPEQGTSYDKLLEMADSAMYQAKQSGRNRIQQATPDI